MKVDVAVIGGGMAGLTAACRLADAGRSVVVISKGDPVCSLSTGCVDITDAGPDPLAATATLPEGHPYKLVDPRTIQEALTYFREMMAEQGLSYVGNPHENRAVLTPMGLERTTALVPSTMEDTAPEKPLFVASFQGMRDFYPSYFRKHFADCSFGEFDAGVASVMGIAARFENEEFVDSFSSWLGRTVPAGARVGVPAVLGLRGSEKIMRKIERKTGAQVFEIATIPPSIPGVRLFSALKSALRRRGGEFLFGAGVVGFEKANGTVTRVRLDVPGRERWVDAERFILATGSFVSGGLLSDEHTVTEPVFGLPVHLPGARDGWFHEDFFAAKHPIQTAGVTVGRGFRPTNGDWDNVFACGAILAHSQVIRYQCGHGVALATGYAAAAACEGTL